MNYKRSFFIACAILIALFSRMGYRRYATRPEQIVQVPKWSSALERVDMNAPTGCVVFIGDSHIAGLYTDNITTPSVNLGIGGDTTLGVLDRIGRYQCIKTARAVVIEVGVNDLQWRGEDQITTNLFDSICYAVRHANPTAPMFICGVPSVREERLKWQPVSNRRIDTLNSYYQLICDRVGEQLNLRYVDMTLGTLSHYTNHVLSWQKHDLPSLFDSGDGIHLNRAGYQVLENEIIIALAKAGVLDDPNVHWTLSNPPENIQALSITHTNGSVFSYDRKWHGIIMPKEEQQP